MMMADNYAIEVESNPVADLTGGQRALASTDRAIAVAQRWERIADACADQKAVYFREASR